MIATVCRVCGGLPLGAHAGPVVSELLCSVAEDDATSAAAAAAASALGAAPSLVRVSTNALLRLRVAVMSRFMDAAAQSSVFPKFKADEGAFDLDAAYYSFVGADGVRDIDHNDLARRFGVLLTPAYLAWGAFDALVPRAAMCALVPAAGGALAAEWSWAALTAGGITLSPDVVDAHVSRLPPAWRAHLARLRAADATAPGGGAGLGAPLDEDYSAGTWRGAVVAEFINRGGLRSSFEDGSGGGGGSSSGSGPSPTSKLPLPGCATLATLHASVLAVHAREYAATQAGWVLGPLEAFTALGGEQGGSLAPALRAGDRAAVKEAMLPAAQNSGSTPHMLTAFNVLTNDFNEMLNPASLAQTLTWGGAPGAAPATLASRSAGVSGCVGDGEPPRAPVPGQAALQAVNESFLASVRYGDNFFHTVEGLTPVFPVAEWTRVRPALSPVHWPSRFASGWLDTLRVPFRSGRGAHAGISDVRARVAHVTDKGACMRFRAGNLLMGRDVLRFSLGLPSGGLPSAAGAGGDKSRPALSAPLPLPPGEVRVFGPAEFPERGVLGDSSGRLPRPQAGPIFDAALSSVAREAGGPHLASAATNSRTPRIVLVQRKMRDVANSEALLAGLRALPVFVAVFEVETAPSVAHTMRQFAEADVLIAAHGAGMSHMLALPRHAIVIEIFQSHLSLCFMRASAALGLRYWAMAARADFVVDVGTIVAKLREELAMPIPLQVAVQREENRTRESRAG